MTQGADQSTNQLRRRYLERLEWWGQNEADREESAVLIRAGLVVLVFEMFALMLADGLAGSAVNPASKSYLIDFFAFHLLSLPGLWELLTRYLLIQGLWLLVPVLIYYGLRFVRRMALHHFTERLPPLPMETYAGPSRTAQRRRWLAAAVGLAIGGLFIQWRALSDSRDDLTASIVLARSIGDTALTAFYWAFLAGYALLSGLGERQRRGLLRLLATPWVLALLCLTAAAYGVAWVVYGYTPSAIAEAIGPRCTTLDVSDGYNVTEYGWDAPRNCIKYLYEADSPGPIGRPDGPVLCQAGNITVRYTTQEPTPRALEACLFFQKLAAAG